MTTITSVNPLPPVAVKPVANLPVVTGLAEPEATLSAPALVVSLGQATTEVATQTYSSRGLLSVVESSLAWERDANDKVTSQMAANFSSRVTSSRFQGLGSSLLQQFATDGNAISQSVLKSANGGQLDAAQLLSDQNSLHNKADNFISFSIRTASGKSIVLTLSSQLDGLGVTAQADGPLTDDELAAIGKLSDGFQAAIDGLTAQPPRLDLSKLTQFDTSVLSSVDLNAKLKIDDKDLTLAFHADSKGRTVSMSGPSGDLQLSVDMQNSKILGNAAQQARALSNYLEQIDQAQGRGKGDKQLMALFKDAFTTLNSNYPQGASATDVDAAEPLTLGKADKALLTGLADFKASVTQKTQASNVMRPDELDTFAYKLSQTTHVKGAGLQNRSVDQNQQSQLNASYHKSLTAGMDLVLTGEKESQNYYYVTVEDKADSHANISYEDGKLVNASLTQSASQNTRTQKYVLAMLEETTVTPYQVSKERSYLALLQAAAKESKKSSTGVESFSTRRALDAMHEKVLLQTNPSKLSA